MRLTSWERAEIEELRRRLCKAEEHLREVAAAQVGAGHPAVFNFRLDEEREKAENLLNEIESELNLFERSAKWAIRRQAE